MRIAIIDPAAGISGDMTLGALLDAGLELSWLESLPARVGFPSVRVSSRKVTRCSVCATKIDFEIREAETGGHGRHVGELIEIVGQADVKPPVLETAQDVDCPGARPTHNHCRRWESNPHEP